MDGTSPIQDQQSVTAKGESVTPLPDGVIFRPTVTHADGRGSLWELFDPRWNAHPDPLVTAYCTTWRPGMIKGWAVHHKHDDRYTILYGELLVALYDAREDSPTKGLVSEIVLSEHRRGLLVIPVGVWHAAQNIGDTTVVIVNFPTVAYDYENPDKYRLPVDTSEIPYTFRKSRGW